MSIHRLKNGSYQAKVRGTDKRWITKTFETKREAEAFEGDLKRQLFQGLLVTNLGNHITLDEFFEQWFQTVQHQASIGWRKCQRQFYETYIHPSLGSRKLKTITPNMIAHVLNDMVKKKKSEATQKHIYNLMRKMFRDAIELFQVVTYNPVLRNLSPRVPLKEAKHLNLDQIKKLLLHVEDKEYGLAIWVQLYMGLRVGELIALKWEDIDLDSATLTVSRNFSRKDSWVAKEKVFKEYPKGKKQHSHRIPVELLQRLKLAKEKAQGEFVAATSFGEMLSYEFYLETLKGYCKELKIPQIGTHGLRHSTSELYLHHGATRDDLRQLFAHSSTDITDRYVHDRGTNLEKVTNVVRLFPRGNEESCIGGSQVELRTIG